MTKASDFIKEGNSLLGKDSKAALKAYEQAIEADPKNEQAHYKKACALKNLGKLQEALKSCDDAI